MAGKLPCLAADARRQAERDLVPRRRWRVAMAVRVGGQPEAVSSSRRTARSTTSRKARPCLKCGTPDCSSSASGAAPRASPWIAPTSELWNRIGSVSSTRRHVCVKKGHGMAGGTRSSMRFRATVGAAACVRWRRRDSSTCRSTSSSRANASDVAPMRVSYRPLPDRNGFDLNVSGTKRAFLLDSSGHWHVTGFVQQAREEDPAPAPCEIDQSQPCDGS